MSTSAARHVPMDNNAMLRSLRHEWAIVQAAAPAVLALVPAALDWYSIETGLWIGVAVNTGVLFIWGAGVRELAGGPPTQAVLSGVASGSLGLLLAVLKFVVH